MIVMKKETSKTEITKIITKKEIETITHNKKSNISQYKFEHLTDYSKSAIGYVRSLLLDDYQEGGKYEL